MGSRPTRSVRVERRAGLDRQLRRERARTRYDGGLSSDAAAELIIQAHHHDGEARELPIPDPHTWAVVMAIEGTIRDILYSASEARAGRHRCVAPASIDGGRSPLRDVLLERALALAALLAADPVRGREN
jgi:hypothetical protein